MEMNGFCRSKKIFAEYLDSVTGWIALLNKIINNPTKQLFK